MASGKRYPGELRERSVRLVAEARQEGARAVAESGGAADRAACGRESRHAARLGEPGYATPHIWEAGTAENEGETAVANRYRQQANYWAAHPDPAPPAEPPAPVYVDVNCASTVCCVAASPLEHAQAVTGRDPIQTRPELCS